MNAIKDSFLETFAGLISEDKYSHFVARCGPIDDIPDEIRVVGQREAVPFINSGCRTSYCVYDISTLHELYSQEFDLTDDFRSDEHFTCFYCDEKISYKNFSTCESLVQAVDQFFGRLPKHGHSNSLRKSIMKSHGSQSNTNIDESLSLVKRRRSRFEEPNSGLKNGIILQEASESDIELQQWVVSDFRPKVVSAAEEPQKSTDTGLPPIPKQVELETPSRRKSSLFLDNSAVTTKFLPRHRKSSTRSFHQSDWRGLKEQLAAVPIPDLKLFDFAELERFKTFLASKREMELRFDPKVTTWLNETPSLEDMRALEQKGRMNHSVFDAVTLYLRCLLCKSDEILSFFWHFTSDMSGKITTEKSLIDKAIVLHNQDQDKAMIILSTGDISEAYVHQIATSRVTKIRLERPSDGQDFDHYLNLLKSVPIGSTSEEKSSMVGVQKLYTDFLAQSTSKLSFHRTDHVSKHGGHLAQLRLILQLAGLEKTFPLFKQQKLEDVVLWILYKLLNPAVKSLGVTFASSTAKTPKIQKPEALLVPIASKVKSQGSSSSMLVDTEETRVDLHQQPKNRPGLTVAAETKPTSSIRVDRKYDEIKSLLEFYHKHDRERHKSLLKKCQTAYSPEIVEYLEKASDKQKKSHKNHNSLNQIRLREIVKSTPTSPKMAAVGRARTDFTPDPARTDVSGSPQTSMHFISSPYLAPYVVRSKQSTNYMLQDKISDQELPILKAQAIPSLRHLEIPGRNFSSLMDSQQLMRPEVHNSYRRINILGQGSESAGTRLQVLPRTTPNSPKGSYQQLFAGSRPRRPS